LITVEYRVSDERASDFLEAMDEMRIFRRREGAISRNLLRDLVDPDRYLETFVVAWWAEHMREHGRVMYDRRTRSRSPYTELS
jgi:transmembrane secretion effector